VQSCKSFVSVPVCESGFPAYEFWAVPATCAIAECKPYTLMDEICQRRGGGSAL